MRAASPESLRPVRFGDLSISVEHRGDGSILVHPSAALPEYPRLLMQRCAHWAAQTPDQVLVAERGPDGHWRRMTYGEAWPVIRRLASSLIVRGLSADRPLMILSGNSMDHLLLGCAALLAGVPWCPVSPAYSLVSKDFAKLRFAVDLLTPGLVYASDAAAFAAALQAAVPEGTEIATSTAAAGIRATLFGEMAETPEFPGLDALQARIDPDAPAKFLLTSGSTGNPKAVINTQRMLCANQMMMRQTLAFLQEAPPVLLDWLPWNHTFGGNHNVGIVLFNGGSLYIDDGKPTPGGIAASVRNLHEIAPTVFFNVPKGFEMLVPFLRADAALRAKFFSRLEVMFFAGAALAAHIWEAIDEISLAQTGARVPMLTGLGATETAPFFMSASPATSRSGHVGLPAPGNVLKLVPNGGKLEARVKGPNVTPGYWRQAELTAKAFDVEGYYALGDALKPVDAADFSAGFDFDGRIAEDFKLASGTWVSTGPLRAQFIAACAPLVRDVVIAGINRDAATALVVLDPDGCRALLPDVPAADAVALAADTGLRRAFRQRLQAFSAAATGSSQDIARAILLDSPLQIDRGEITDKGSVNQRAVLEFRAELVDELYAGTPSSRVISIHDAR